MAYKTYKKVKSLLLIILSCLMSACLITGLLPRNTASADRSVTISGSSIFYTSGDSAAVWAHREIAEGDDAENPEYPEYYSMFVLWDSSSAISYRKHLAYSWIENDAVENFDKEEDKDTDGDNDDGKEDDTEKPVVSASITPKSGWFHMEIGFEDYSFKKFIITFESQQYTQTKDGKTSNYIMFYPNEDKTGVRVVISGDVEDAPSGEEEALDGHITIEFTEESKDIVDGYAVKVSGTNGAEASGEFHNVGHTFSKYSSSSTTPVTPLSFKAEFNDKEEDGNKDEDNSDGETYDNDRARMVLYNLNNQSFRVGTYKKVERDEDGNLKLGKDSDNNDIKFEDVYKKYYVKTVDGRGYERNAISEENKDLDYYTYTPSVTSEDGHYRGGTINDNAPPVICFTNGVSHIGVGKELPFDYQLIDVLASSPSADTYYYMLTTEQANDPDFDSDNYLDKNLFRMVTDSDNQYMEPHKNHYIPKDSEVGSYDDENFKVVAAVKVYLKLYDTRTESINQTTYVLLDWFVNDNNLVKIKNSEGEVKDQYIAVANDEQGVSFAYTKGGESNTEDEDWLAIKNAYQELVNEAAKELKAGSKNYFYLPALEKIKYTNSQGEEVEGSLLADNVTAYKDLSFNVYYNNGSNGNTTTQKSNALSINLSKAGRYIFTIYATDKNSNPMYYYKKEGDENEKKTFTASNIWSMRESKKNTDYEGTKDYLPWFIFNVESSEIEIEDPGEREAAFVGTKYTSISFDINAVSYERKYELYRFDNDIYYKDKGVALTYEQFMKEKADLLENHPNWFTEIPAANSLTAGTGSLLGVEKQARHLGEAAQEVAHRCVRHHSYIIFFKMLLHLGSKFRLIYEKNSAVFIYKQEGDKHRGETDVARSAQVGGPGNVVERGEEHRIGQLTLHFGHHTVEFGVYILADDRLVMDEELVVGA